MPLSPCQPRASKNACFWVVSLFQPPRVSSTDGPVPVMTSISAVSHDRGLPFLVKGYAPEPESEFSSDCCGRERVASYEIRGYAGSMPLSDSAVSHTGHGAREGKIVGRGRFTEEADRWLLFGGSLALPCPMPFDVTLSFSTH